MKSTVQRAQAAQQAQRQQREAREFAQALAQMDQLRTPPAEPQPAAPEIPATLPSWQRPDPDPVLTAEFLAGMALGALLTSASVALMLGVRP